MPVQSPVKPSLNNSDMTQAKESYASQLIDKIPIPLVLSLAKPYLAGQTPEEAIQLAHKIYSNKNHTSTLDILGEDMDSDLTCDKSVRQYKDLVDAIKSNPLPVKNPRHQLTISLKPSMFSTKAPEGAVNTPELDKAFNRIEEVVDYAKGKEVNVTLEAEDHRWTDFHLDTYFKIVKNGYAGFGTVLQTRLFRTEHDLEKFDDRMRVRLVIGIYNEPASIALTDKAKMKDLAVDYAQELLKKGVYVELATHDLHCIDNFVQKVVIPDKVSPELFEFQFLHGVPRDQIQLDLCSGSYFSKIETENQFTNHLKESGLLVRKYLPFGVANVAGAYCRRRLKENPNMISYGIKNLFGYKF